MENYTVEVELDRRDDLTSDAIDAAMTELAEYGVAIGTTPRGYVSARLTFPAASLPQAINTAATLVAKALDGTVSHLEGATEAEAERRAGEVPVPDLIGVQDAAGMLGVTVQRVRQMIGEGKLAAYRIGERSYALTRSEVEAKSA